MAIPDYLKDYDQNKLRVVDTNIKGLLLQTFNNNTEKPDLSVEVINPADTVGKLAIIVTKFLKPVQIIHYSWVYKLSNRNGEYELEVPKSFKITMIQFYSGVTFSIEYVRSILTEAIENNLSIDLPGEYQYHEESIEDADA